MIPRLSVLAIPVLLCALGGCRVVDQRSFGGAPRLPPPDQLSQALASHGGTPLIVIGLADAAPYDDVLRTAVEAAEARDADVHFRIDAVCPATGTLDAQQAALVSASQSGRTLADRLGDLGIAADRVALAARTDPAATRCELRLYTQ